MACPNDTRPVYPIRRLMPEAKTPAIMTSTASVIAYPDANEGRAQTTAPVSTKSAADAANFRPGDVVTITGTTIRETVARVDGTNVRLQSPIAGTVGATVVRVNEGDPVQLVLDRLDRLRGMRSRR